MFNRWPTLILSIVLLFGIAIYFRRFDFLFLNEEKALLSVLFGFASSCILLSFIWFLQKKMIQEAWQNDNRGPADIPPNMHPSPSLESLDSLTTRQNIPVRAISTTITKDQPPNYEDALINSKPVDWHYYLSKKATTINQQVENNFRCIKHIKNFGTESVDQPVQLVSSIDCSICSNDVVADRENKNINHDSNGMAQLALSIVRGFTSLEMATSQSSGVGITSLQVAATRGQQSSSRASENSTRRKSFCQLDVNQLMQFSNSPPKYCDLSFGGSNQELSNYSNEPRAGINFV